MSTVFGFTPKEAPSPMDIKATAEYNKKIQEEKERLEELKRLRKKYNNPVLGMEQAEAMDYVTAMGSTDSIRGLGQIFAKATGWDSLDENLKKKDKKLHAIFQNEEYGGKAFASFLGSAIVLDPVSYVPVAGWAKKAKNIKTLGEFAKYGAKSSAILGGISYTSEDIPGLITEADDGFLKKKAEQVGLSAVAGGALTGTLGTASNIFAKVVGNEVPFPVSSFWSKETGAETTSGQKIKNNFENPEKRTPKILQNLNTNYQKYVGEPAWKAIQANPAEFLGGSTGALIGYGTSGSVIDEETRTVDVKATQKQRLTRTALFAALGAGVPYALKQNDAIRETVGRLVINDYGLSAERIAARQNFTITKNSIADEFGDLTSRVADNLDVEQRKLLYGLMTGEIKTLDKSLDLPMKKQIESFNKEGRDLINKYAEEFRDAGMLDPEVFKKNINTYLRRSYLKQNKIKDTDTRLYEINKDIRVIGDEFKPRGIFDEVSSKEFNKKNGVWQQEGWEKVDTLSNGKFKVRRDLTKEERVDLEEIEDAAYAIAETGRLFANDIATMRFFDDLSKDSKYVLSTEDYSKLSNKEKKKFTIVSKDTIKDTDVQKFGNLSGKYVDKSVFKDVQHIFKIGTQEDFYRQQGIKQAIQLQQLWKKMKTSYNPGTHVANTMSNIMLLDVAAGTDFKYVIKAIKEMRKGNDSKIYRQAKVDGFMDSNLVSKELNEYGSQIERNLTELQGNLGHVESGIWGYTKNALKYVKKQTVDRAEKLYSLEDSVFRMAVYMDRLDKGVSRVDATLDARKLFVDYDINAPLIKGLKNTAVPFISYTYRIIPILAEAAVKNPVKYAKWAGIAWAADEIGKEVTNDTGEVNRLTMQEYNNQKMFGLPFMPSTNIRLPFNDEKGNAMYINMARWVPGGDIFEQKSGEGSKLPFLPQPLQPGGFYVDAWTNFYNKIDPFTGRKIEGNTLTHFLKRQPPNIPFLSIPYIGDTFATEKIKKASRADTTSLTNKLVYQYEEQFGTAPSPYSPQMSPWVAIAQGLGIKLNPQDKEINKEAKQKDFDREYNQLNSEISKAFKDWENQRMSFEEYEKIKNNNTEEIIKISAEHNLLTEKISVAESKETQTDYIKKYYPFYGRLNKFEGGEVDVPFTKDEPEDRVDSFTGLPYSDQMARLGLQDGGRTDNFILKSIKELGEEKKYNFDYEKAFDDEGNRKDNILVNKGNTRADFVRDVYLNAKARGLKYPEIVASQAAAESRYGASKIAQEANNLFGIKLRKGEEGLAKEFMTKEDYGEGQVPEKANFRVFNSVDESIQGYDKFINDKKYSQALQSGTPMEYLQGIKDAGYATDQSYVQTVGDVYQQYKNAGIFD